MPHKRGHSRPMHVRSIGQGTRKFNPIKNLRNSMPRRLCYEQLEDRELPCTAADVLGIITTINGGYYAPEHDLNKNGVVEPLDALIAINAANRQGWQEQPVVLQVPTGGWHSQYFSPCGSSYALEVYARAPATNVFIQVGAQVYLPVSVGTFGAFNTWTFQVEGRGLEYLKLLGDLPSGELFTVILGEE